MSKTDLRGFLEFHVEGYLFADLEHLDRLGALSGSDKGAAGYPMLACTLAGMELLGTLLSPTQLISYRKTNKRSHKLAPNTTHKQVNCLDRYWKSVLSEYSPLYAPYQETARFLVRNPLAHNFVTTSRIIVLKPLDTSWECACQFDRNRGIVGIDCRLLYRHLRESYEKLVAPVSLGTSTLNIEGTSVTAGTMESRLHELVAEHSQLEQNAIESLVQAHLARDLSAIPLYATANLAASVSWSSAAASGVAFSSLTTATFTPRR